MEAYLYPKKRKRETLFKKSDVSCNHGPSHTRKWDCVSLSLSLSLSLCVSVSVSPFSVQFVILETNFNL